MIAYFLSQSSHSALFCVQNRKIKQNMKKLTYTVSFVCAALLTFPAYAQEAIEGKTQLQSNSAVNEISLDQKATDKASWKIGDEVATGVAEGEFDENLKNEKVYRKFLGITPEGRYLVQSFFTSDNAKLTDPYLLITQQAVTDTQFSGHERLVQGEYNQWYHDGAQHTAYNYDNGKLNGLQNTWYNNGKKMLEVTYRDGLAEGLATVWDSDGFKISEIIYLNNKVKEIKNFAYGLYEIAHYVMEDDGESAQVVYRYKDGQKESEGFMLREDRKQGPWTSWYENGQMREQGEYNNNEKVGDWKSWDVDGTLIEEKNYGSADQ